MSFMGEEILKQEYIILRDKMNVIKKNLIELEDIYEDLIINIKDNFIIDNKIIFEDSFDKIKLDLKTIKEETINEIIPTINNNI